LNGGGILGPFVTFEGQPGFLTCAHVLFDINSSSFTYDATTSLTNVDVVQPAAGTYSLPGNVSKQVANKPCGCVKKAIFYSNATSDVSIDAAVVNITDPSRVPVRGEFAINHPINLRKGGNLSFPLSFHLQSLIYLIHCRNLKSL